MGAVPSRHFLVTADGQYWQGGNSINPLPVDLTGLCDITQTQSSCSTFFNNFFLISYRLEQRLGGVVSFCSCFPLRRCAWSSSPRSQPSFCARPNINPTSYNSNPAPYPTSPSTSGLSLPHTTLFPASRSRTHIPRSQIERDNTTIGTW